METKKTAVDWVKSTLECYGGKYELVISWDTFDEILERAKAMEKEQIIKAYSDSLPIEDGVITVVQKAKIYYNKSYGK